MTTLAVLKARIADELSRSDLTSQIVYAISDAVKNYQSTRFWFNETRGTTFSTVASQEHYGSAANTNIPNLLLIDQIVITTGTSNTELCKVDDRVLEEMDTTSTGGLPWAYSYYAQQIRLYPIPDAIYSVRITGVVRIDVPAADGDSNAWMTDGEELIRNRAKSLIYSDVIRNNEMAQISDAREKAALKRLLMETSRRKGVSTIRPVEL